MLEVGKQYILGDDVIEIISLDTDKAFVYSYTGSINGILVDEKVKLTGVKEFWVLKKTPKNQHIYHLFLGDLKEYED